jgi:hypothetical protein
MTAPALPPEPGPAGALTRDPVRWTWIIYGFVQAVVTVLLATEVLSAQAGAIVTGIALALYVAVSELFTRPETVPRVPLEELAAGQTDIDSHDIEVPPVGIDPTPPPEVGGGGVA